MHHFADQLQPAQQPARSLRASQYRPASKRKRGQHDEDAEEPPIASPGHDVEGPLPPSNAQSHASLDSLETAQLRVAGLLPEDEFHLPPPPFPHAPPRASRDAFNYTKLQKELAGLDPPLYAVKAASKSDPVDRKSERPALRQTHLDVLSTMMHHCLLEGDYHRAGRAWGMILRTQIAGLPVDPRNHGRWGIGAEILLRRNARNQSIRRQSSRNDTESADGEQISSDESTLYTEEGFELAREYYERLIVQHPNRKQLQHSIDDRTFYPAMFSLWIYETCEKSRREQQRLEKDVYESTTGSISFDEDTTMASDDARARASATKEAELRQAKEIAQRIGQLVVSPPFDKHADLLQLRGMVGLWMSDLVLGEDSLGQEEDDWNSNKPHENRTKDSISEKRKRYLESVRELRESLNFFERAQLNGQCLWGTIASVEAKIKDLTKRMGKLGE